MMSPQLIRRTTALRRAAPLASLMVLGLMGPVHSGPVQMQILPAAPAEIRAADETVSLMVGLIAIESDLILGQLFLNDGLTNAAGSHFTRPRTGDFALIKDGLSKAGAPDLEPLLIALEEATDKAAVTAAFAALLGGLQRAETALQPTEQDIMAAIIQSVEAAGGHLDPSGTSEVTAYQEAWGLLMAARAHLDTLTSSSDPALRKSSAKLALAFDDVILMAPDPNASAPVAFDPALVAQLVATLKGEAGSI
jgi:hypothetical protein